MEYFQSKQIEKCCKITFTVRIYLLTQLIRWAIGLYKYSSSKGTTFCGLLKNFETKEIKMCSKIKFTAMYHSGKKHNKWDGLFVNTSVCHQKRLFFVFVQRFSKQRRCVSKC